MNSDNQLVIYFEDDGDFRVYCGVCDCLCIERFYNIHLKSQNHINNIRKKEQSDESFQVISLL